MGLPENYGTVEYDDDGNIVTYEGIPIEQYQIPLLYRTLPPHKRKIVQSIFYCYALDEMEDFRKTHHDMYGEAVNDLIERVKNKPAPPIRQAVSPEDMPKKRRSKKR